jgi:hypothetical protein
MLRTTLGLLLQLPSDLLRLASLTKAQLFIVVAFSLITQTSNQLPELILGYAELPGALLGVKASLFLAMVFSLILAAYGFENIVNAEIGSLFDRFWKRRFLISAYLSAIALGPVVTIIFSINSARLALTGKNLLLIRSVIATFEFWFVLAAIAVVLLTAPFCFYALERKSNLRVQTFQTRQTALLLVAPVFAVATWIFIWSSLTGSPPLLKPLEGGTVFFVLVFFVILTIVISCLSSLLNYISWPAFALAFVAYYAWLCASNNNDHHFITGNRLALDIPADDSQTPNQSSLDQRFQAWLDQRRIKSRPVYIIAAQGGGIYAAYHAASTIVKLVGPEYNLADDIFAISGVSGGSVGTAVALSVLESVKLSVAKSRPAQVDQCHTAWLKYDITQLALDRIFETDYVFPLIMGGLFVDSILEVTPSTHFSKYFTEYDRSYLLERAFVNRTQQVLTDLLEEVPGNSSLDGAFLDLRATFSPDLYFNIVSTNTGDRGYLGKFELNQFKSDTQDPDGPEKRNLNRALKGLNLKLITAAVLSARYPYVTPPASIRKKGDNINDEEVLRFVDGGYLENSGVATALDIAREIQPKTDVPVKIIALGNRNSQTIENSSFNELVTPFRTMLQTRVARGEDYIDDAVGLLGGNVVQVRTRQPPAFLTLGWFLSKSKLRDLELRLNEELHSKKELGHRLCDNPVERSTRLRTEPG